MRRLAADHVRAPSVADTWETREDACQPGHPRDRGHALKRRRFLQLAGALPVASAAPRVASAQTYPARPVRWIIGFAPGGAADVVVRMVADGMSERLGRTVIVDNRPGAGTNIATEAV